MAPRRKCPVCGSKQWHKEPSSGLITCSEGHVLQNYRNETMEVDELGPHAVKKRTLKSGRKKQGRRSKADPKLYHGGRARYHYFQCLQLILRMQVVALTERWKLPPEFEKVCRDLWALHLTLLPRPPVAEPLHHLQLASGIASSSQATSVQSTQVHKAEDSDGHESDRSQGSHPSVKSDLDSDEDSEENSELEHLMRENSDFSSSEDEDGDPDNPAKERVYADFKKKKKRTMFGPYDLPDSTISVLVVACWTLRLPVMYMDFVRLVESYDLLYLDSLRQLPENMTRHLRKQTVQALSPYHTPSPVRLHRLSSRLARLLNVTYGVYTPELNAAPVLWKAVRSLQGSPVLYVMAKKLGRIVSIPVMLHRSLAPALQVVKKKDPTFHKSDNVIPEVSLVAAVIVVMKMVYGLDGRPRQPREDTDPAYALPELGELIRALNDADAADMKRAPVFSLETNRSVLDMDDEMLDEYMSFCEKALLPREDRMPAHNLTSDRFPLHSGETLSNLTTPSNIPTPPSEEWERPTFNANVINDEDVLKPGEEYMLYNTQDILGSLPDDLQLVTSRAAKWAGVDEDYVSTVVDRYERRIMRWWSTFTRNERRVRQRMSGSDEDSWYVGLFVPSRHVQTHETSC